MICANDWAQWAIGLSTSLRSHKLNFNYTSIARAIVEIY